MTQGVVPEQPSPLQPLKNEPLVGVAVRVMTFPAGKLVTQLSPQLIPGGLLTTVPKPVPVLAIVKAKPAAGEPHASFE